MIPQDETGCHMAINEIALSVSRRVKLLISIGINTGKGKRDVKGLPVCSVHRMFLLLLMAKQNRTK